MQYAEIHVSFMVHLIIFSYINMILECNDHLFELKLYFQKKLLTRVVSIYNICKIIHHILTAFDYNFEYFSHLSHRMQFYILFVHLPILLEPKCTTSDRASPHFDQQLDSFYFDFESFHFS